MDAWSAGAAKADSEREEDEHSERPAGAIRFSGVYIRATLQPADGRPVPWVQTVAEECEAVSGECARALGT